MKFARVLGFMVLLAASPGALAHAFLDHATPAVGSQVHGSPDTLTLWFSEALEPAFSSIKVLDAAGKQVDRGDTAADPKDPTALKVSLQHLAPGEYRVMWRVLSVDTHVTEGKFTFSVRP
ncbi:MAG TPA: copper homeostasis periplasmic binding protein CopC [Burkholderiales bacterium]|nr:copper homeostasis periplasmic binding protein CopC [Burkholderiales bacterium]